MAGIRNAGRDPQPALQKLGRVEGFRGHIKVCYPNNAKREHSGNPAGRGEAERFALETYRKILLRPLGARQPTRTWDVRRIRFKFSELSDWAFRLAPLVRQPPANSLMPVPMSLAQRSSNGARVFLNHCEVGEQSAIGLGAALFQIPQPRHIDAVGLRERSLA
jgi:hypothetical protein